MEQLILWFNILGFVLLFSSLGVTWMVYSRLKTRWLFPYLLYLGLYAVFTVFNTYEFFSKMYISFANPFFNTLSMYITFIIGLVLLMVVPWFINRLLSGELSLKQRLFPVVMLVLFIIMMTLSAIFPEWKLNNAGSVVMNGYLGFFTLYGILRISKKGKKPDYGVVTPALYLSCTFYFIVVLENIIFPLTLSPLRNLQINHFTAGFICFSWGLITSIYLFIKNSRNEIHETTAVTEPFKSKFGITPREQEIISLLLTGKSHKEIGEELFVSPRTVETHVYNIYRKCTVKNKIELGRLLSTFNQDPFSPV